MDWKLELVAIPVSDVDRAKAFYTEKAGFNADYDHTVSDEIRFVQLTPPGSACSIAQAGSARANSDRPLSSAANPARAQGRAERPHHRRDERDDTAN